MSPERRHGKPLRGGIAVQILVRRSRSQRKASDINGAEGCVLHKSIWSFIQQRRALGLVIMRGR